MSADDSRVGGEEEPQDLQFDRVETTTPRGDATALPAVTCAVCGKSVDREYYHANGKPICDSCRQVVTAAAATPRSVRKFVAATVYGLGAAIAGAAIYYAVIAIADLEIGIVAILIGYMVGWAVRKGAGGSGGRRFQVLAVVLTYWAVGLAYTPLAFKELSKDRKESSTNTLTSDSTASSQAPTVAERLGDTTVATTSADSAKVVSKSEGLTGRDVALAFGGLFLFAFALPLLSIFGSMPLGLISALIIFIGLSQAWRMTGRPELAISGPYKVGTGPVPAAS
jgi:hypothetical protein